MMLLQEIMNLIGEIAKDTLNIIDINSNTAISLFLKILCNNELATGEELLEHTAGTVALVGTLLYVGALLAHHMTRCV